MSGLCKDCRYWRQMREGEFYDRSLTGACTLTRTFFNEEIEPDTKAAAINEDNTGVMWLATAPDFGCVQFSSRVEEA